jgi:hypothetical protein
MKKSKFTEEQIDFALRQAEAGKLKRCLFSIIALFFFILPHLEGARAEMVLNPKGWNLPDTKRMIPARVEKLTLADIPFEIRVEVWTGNTETTYQIRNLLYGSLPALTANRPVLENPLDLFIFKTPEGKTLCYRYCRQITDKSGFAYGAVITYICDLDDDGLNEFQMEAGIEPAKLLTAIIKIKLGLSEQTDLIRRTISSALRAMKR